MKHEADGISDVGRVREHNEDHMVLDHARGLYIVCDGVGGEVAGEIASAETCRIIHEMIQHDDAWIEAFGDQPNPATQQAAVELVEKAVRWANDHVIQLARDNPQCARMSCTLAMMILRRERAIMAHVGDSRIYLWREGELFQLTSDHSVAAEQVRRGRMTRRQARHSPDASVLTQAIGFQPYVELTPMTIEVLPGDRFLICSDGLSDFVDDTVLAQMIRRGTAQDIVRQLVLRANARGGADNITAVVVIMPDAAVSAKVAGSRRLELLRRLTLFENLSYAQLLSVLQTARVNKYPAGHTLIREGEIDDKLFVLVSGTIQVAKQGQELARLEPGAFFGEMSLIDQLPRSADVVTCSDVQVLTIDRQSFFSLLQREPRIAAKLLWSISRVLNHRLRETSEELAWTRSMAPLATAEVPEAFLESP